MNKVICILLVAVVACQTKNAETKSHHVVEDSDNQAKTINYCFSGDSLFDTTIFLIDKFTGTKEEISGPITTEISNNVFELIYSSSGELSAEKKIFLLHKMLLNQESATQKYRSKVVEWLARNRDTIETDQFLYLAPISVCSYCDNSIIDSLDIPTNEWIAGLNEPYDAYYSKLIKLIREIKTKKNVTTQGDIGRLRFLQHYFMSQIVDSLEELTN